MLTLKSSQAICSTQQGVGAIVRSQREALVASTKCNHGCERSKVCCLTLKDAKLQQLTHIVRPGFAPCPLAVLLVYYVVLSAKNCTVEAAHMSQSLTLCTAHASWYACTSQHMHHGMQKTIIIMHHGMLAHHSKLYLSHQACRQWLGKQDLHATATVPQQNKQCNNSVQHAAAAMLTELPRTAAAITNAYQGQCISEAFAEPATRRPHRHAAGANSIAKS